MPSDSKSKPTGQKAPEAGTGGALSRLGELGWQALPAIGSAIGFAGFVAVIGAAIEWIRFDAANLPATQAVLAVPEKELVIIGALALAAFVLGAVLAVMLVYLIDSNGDATPNTARGLVAVGFFEMVATLCFIEVHHPVAYALLGIWLVVIGLAAAYVVAAVMADFTRRTQLQRARAKWSLRTKSSKKPKRHLTRLTRRTCNFTQTSPRKPGKRLSSRYFRRRERGGVPFVSG
jgi:hypothetical protein